MRSVLKKNSLSEFVWKKLGESLQNPVFFNESSTIIKATISFKIFYGYDKLWLIMINRCFLKRLLVNE